MKKFVFLYQFNTLRFKGLEYYLSLSTTKPTKSHAHPVKTLISLCIHTVLSESLRSPQWVANDPGLFMRTGKTDYQSLLYMCDFVGFVMFQLILFSTALDFKIFDF